MADWAKELGQKVLEGEREVDETWKRLIEGVRQAVTEVDSVLKEKSNLKLSVDHATPDHLTVKNDRNMNLTLGLNRVSRQIVISGTVGSGQLYITHVADKLQYYSASQNPLLGIQNSSQVTVDDLVKKVVTYVVDIR